MPGATCRQPARATMLGASTWGPAAMNKPIVVAASVAFFFSASCPATDCLLPAFQQPGASLSWVAPEMFRPVIADPYCVSAQDALARIRAQTAALATGAPGAYVPLTKFDNTPWRFDMTQNGKKMTSVEFAVWMKAKGIHVATGKAAPASAPGGSPIPTTPAQSGQ